MRFGRSALFVALCAVFLQTGSAQKKGSASSAVLVDQTAPGTYVTYVTSYTSEYREKGENGRRAILCLHNNYRFSAEVSVYNVEDGPILVRNKKEEVVGIEYDLVAFSENKELPKTRFSTEVLTGVSLDPGESLLFSIPIEHLTNHTEIWIPFRIVVESRLGKPGSGPEHFVVFRGRFMPNAEADRK